MNGNDKTIITESDIEYYAEKLKNWNRWGPDDEIGTLNFATPDTVAAAAKLIINGKRISMGLPFDKNGPQQGGNLQRFNPIHFMRHSGVDGYAGLRDITGIRGADDWIIMPLQCGTQWDALSHIFYKDQMYNGYHITEVWSYGAKRNGIEKTKDKIAGRGVLLDVARFKQVDELPAGYAITSEDLDATAKYQGVEVKKGDFIIVRTGQMEGCLARKNWGTYAGGDAPGLGFHTVEWIHKKEIAAIATDTWGAEVRPNNSGKISQPWHWIVIPIIGLTVGEIFYLKDLADDCAADGRYEFMFVAASLPFTGAVGTPTNPMAFK